MKIKQAKFLGSWEKSVDIPHNKLPEFAFIGRSNVGKSSLINMLTERKDLAKTSSKPGKTQTLNIFNCDDTFQICDLPGYGYAKVSKEKRFKFATMIKYYLRNRENLFCLFILIDLRIPPQSIDLEFINDCGADQIPIVLIGTKADKLKKTELENNHKAIIDALSQDWEEIPPFIITSSETGLGKDEVWDVVKQAMIN
jgi:GTP-binding protein